MIIRQSNAANCLTHANVKNVKHDRRPPSPPKFARIYSGRHWLIAVLAVFAMLAPARTGAATNTFSFSNTTVAGTTGPVYATNGVLVINGATLTAGESLVFDGIVSDVPGSAADAWGAVELNSGGGYLGLVNAALGVLVETGTNSGNPCQLFLNGASSSTTFGTAQGSTSNRVYIILTCTQAGSTTNMNYMVAVDQGLRGSFSGTISGSAVSFANNTIGLAFGANVTAHLFLQTAPVFTLTGLSMVATNTPATLTATLNQGYLGSAFPQWASNGAPIPNATNLTYTTPALGAATAAVQYVFGGSNQFAAFISATNNLTVRGVPGLVPFIFSPTALANDTELNPLTPPSVIYGSELLAGDTVVVDTVVSTNGAFANADGWVGIDLDAGGFEGVTTAQLGLLVRLGSGASQLFVNGAAYGANPASAGALTNRARLELFPSKTGSTTNMGWQVQLDPNYTGTFLPAVSGTNLTFPGNVIPLALSAYDVPGLVVPLPVGLLAFHQVLTATNIPLGAFDQVVSTEDFLNESNVVLAASTPGLTYASSNPNVLTVSATGYLQTVAAGTAVVTTKLGGLTASNLVTVVNAGALLGLSISAASPISLYTNELVAVTGNFMNLTNVNLLRYGTTSFSSGNSNILTVSPAGVLTPVAPGTAAVTAYNGGLASAPLFVTVAFPTNRFIFDTFNDGYWSLVNAGNTNSLVISAAGASQFTAANAPFDQQFQVLYNLQNSTFRLLNRTAEQCLGGVGTSIVPTNYNGALAQQWYLVDAGGGAFRIVNAQTGLAMQTDNGHPAQVTLASAASTPFQIWSLVYQTHFPKKGIAGYEGDFAELELDWAYNYADNTAVALPTAVDFVPMIHDANWEPLGDVQARSAGWRAEPQADYLLSYNEPDNASQANMTTNQVAGLWPALEALDVPLLSPATQGTLDNWENNYFSLMAANNYRVDYAAVHEYVPPSASSLIADCEAVYNAYGKPVWLTEFSPVDWSNTKAWSEDDDYNFLAEFMWQAEGQPWLRRYAIFPFSGTNSASPWVDNGYSGTFFLADGATLSPYGELFATWDADMGLDTRVPYLLHNLATSFRLTETNASSLLQACDIYVRNAQDEWGLLPAPTTNHWYVVSLNDGRRLRDSGGNLNLAVFGSTGSAVEWEFNGPDGSGYYFITNTAGHCLNSSGADPAVTFNLTSAATQNNNTRWRLVKAYQPVSALDTVPASVTLLFTNQGEVALNWAHDGNLYYNVYRALTNGGPYSLVSRASTNYFVDTSATTNGLPYYYVITGLNVYGDESAMSAPVAATVGAVWRQQWFGATANAGSAADTADPAGDGIINILKRAFNLNPLVAATSGLPYGKQTGGTFTLVYQQNLAATDLIFQAQSSPDLFNWSATNVTDVIVAINGATAIHNASVPLTGNAQYLRVLVKPTQ